MPPQALQICISYAQTVSPSPALAHGILLTVTPGVLQLISSAPCRNFTLKHRTCVLCHCLCFSLLCIGVRDTHLAYSYT